MKRFFALAVVVLSAAPLFASGGQESHDDAATSSSHGSKPLERPASETVPIPEYAWIEAEKYTDSSGTSTETFDSTVISAGEWVDLLDVAGERFIEWDNIQIPSDGTYNIYVRKFWKHGPFQWELNGDATRSGMVPFEVSLLDEMELYRFRVANWIHVGTVDVTAGRNSFRIVQESSGGPAAYDVVLFIKGLFDPRGTLRPDQRYDPIAEEGYFDFQPTRDTFRPTPLDLRYLNEDVAGSRGWITARGPDFVYPDTGEAVRLWGINLDPQIYALPDEHLRHLARFYAKRGINHVRLTGPIFERSGTSMGTVDDRLLDRLLFAVETFKQEGIYATISIYFPLWIEVAPDDSRFPGYNYGHPFALPYFNEAFEALYRTWVDAVLTTVSPYSGVALRDEPAVVSFELINEDSYLFWTFADWAVPEEQMILVERKFAEWAADSSRYGSREATLAAWNEPHERDNETLGTLGLPPLWVFEFEGPPHSRRKLDSVRFLTEDMRAFYERSRDYVQETIGYGGLVQGTNWITAGPTRLDPLEKWANASMDYLDRHGYFDTAHYGFSSAWAVAEGNIYQSRSALRFDDAYNAAAKNIGNPAMAINYADRPSMISEINWPEPNRYRADIIPYIATYAALQGTDAIGLFTTTSDSWSSTTTLKFPMQTPTTLVQFPGAALIFRRGLIRTGSPAVEVDLSMDRLWDLEGTPMPQPQNLENLRDPGQGGNEGSIRALSFLVGPVDVDFAEQADQTTFTDNSASYIDIERQIVRSNTDEVELNYGIGVLTIDAPQAQGVVGFIGTSAVHELTDLTISSDLEHASVLVVALDGTPLAGSESILVQVSTEDRPSGFRDRPATQAELDEVLDSSNPDEPPPAFSDSRYIEGLGWPPLMVRNMSGTIGLRRDDAETLSVYASDVNGNLIARVGTADSFVLYSDVFYYYITAGEEGVWHGD